MCVVGLVARPVSLRDARDRGRPVWGELRHFAVGVCSRTGILHHGHGENSTALRPFGSFLLLLLVPESSRPRS